MQLKRTDEITLCLTADICNAVFPEHREIRRWDEIICAGVKLEQNLSHLHDDFGNSPRITWFVRADPWMRRRFKSSTFLFERHRAHLSLLNVKGHEIGWHPHLDSGNLGREMEELSGIAEKVRNLFNVTSVRSGEGFHHNDLMRLFNELKFTADSTALPGRFNHECRTPFDWKHASETPYFPNPDNYQINSKGNSTGILEIPFTMLPIRLPHDKPGPAARYMNFSYYPELFQIGVLAKRSWTDVLIGIVHPAEIAPPRGHIKRHNLLSFDENSPERNIKSLIDRLHSLGKRIRFRTIRETQSNIREAFEPQLTRSISRETVLSDRII